MVAKEVGGFLNSRTKIKKAVAKSLKDVKKMEGKSEVVPLEEKQEAVSLIHVLRDSELITLDVLASLLSIVVGQKAVPQTSKWCMVSKFIPSKRIACEGEVCSQVNKFEAVDAAVHMLISQTVSKSKNSLIKEVRCQLGELDSVIQDLQGKLECLSRHLIKARVTLLNILNH
ncbi:hypothetical protein Ancab_017257 [Ancistrocladus abbreviatus]